MSKLQSVFGMYEMEVAAEIILELQKDQEIGSLRPMYLDNFSGNDAKIGFLELIYNGFMTKQDFDLEKNVYTYNGSFVPNQEFFNRIQNRLGSALEAANRNVELRKASIEDTKIDLEKVC